MGVLHDDWLRAFLTFFINNFAAIFFAASDSILIINFLLHNKKPFLHRCPCATPS